MPVILHTLCEPPRNHAARRTFPLLADGQIKESPSTLYSIPVNLIVLPLLTPLHPL